MLCLRTASCQLTLLGIDTAMCKDRQQSGFGFLAVLAVLAACKESSCAMPYKPCRDQSSWFLACEHALQLTTGEAYRVQDALD